MTRTPVAVESMLGNAIFDTGISKRDVPGSAARAAHASWPARGVAPLCPAGAAGDPDRACGSGAVVSPPVGGRQGGTPVAAEFDDVVVSTRLGVESPAGDLVAASDGARLLVVGSAGPGRAAPDADRLHRACSHPPRGAVVLLEEVGHDEQERPGGRDRRGRVPGLEERRPVRPRRPRSPRNHRPPSARLRPRRGRPADRRGIVPPLQGLLPTGRRRPGTGPAAPPLSSARPG
jgi:hypothetical protein